MSDWHDAARDHIKARVWSGDYDPSDAFEIIADCDLGWRGWEATEENKAWLRAAIQQEFQAKLDAERDWPQVTDCDRLLQVFDCLAGLGILTDELACGFTTQEGFSIMEERYEEEGGKESGHMGLCFFHQQDMERAMRTDLGLFLAFGSFPERDEDTVLVGRLISEECQRAGFEVEWDGTADSRILLKGFRWQRRS